MFDEQTYDAIKERMLENIKGNIDKREGSFVNDLVSPKALELARAYFNMTDILNMAFVENNSFEYLDMKVGEWGLTRKEGIKTVGEVTFTGKNGTHIGNGSILECDNLRYILLNDVIIGQENIGYIEALESGSKYNLFKDSIFYLAESILGVEQITNAKTFDNGTDEETDEELLARFHSYVRKSSTSGSVSDYYNWALEIIGIGDAKVYPTWNGGGTVKVVVCGSNRKAVSDGLLTTTRDYIEIKRPVGAAVTIESAREKLININVTITLGDEFNLEDIQQNLKGSIESYFYDIAFKSRTVSIARIGNLILETEGVLDYSEFTINEITSNIGLEDDEVPVLGTMVVI